MIYVFLRRHVKKNLRPELDPLLTHLRQLALSRNGYISGQTLTNTENDEDVIVISKWTNKDQWDAWFNSEERIAVEERVNLLLEKVTQYEIFEIKE